jgi:RNA polymerase sigma factor (sigma-70 family)
MEASAVPREAPAGVAGILSPRVLRVASDARLVAWIREGHAAAFEALYDRHHRAILSFCQHMLGSLEEAEDAAQHTFLAAFNALAASEKPIHLRAWLFTIARNRCFSILRRRREQPLAEVAEPTTEGLATLVQRRQDLRDLVRDMRRLPDDQRAALVLAEMDALSHEQVGAVLGVPTPKVKALVFQARESLLASRSAREADCAEIREQLANLHGGALRRAQLRRHLRDCPGCRDFRSQVDRQRRQLRALIPVAPAVAIKQALLSASGGGTAGGIAGGGLLTSSSLKGATLVGAVLAGVGAAGTIIAIHGSPQVWPALSTPRRARVVAAPRPTSARTAIASTASPAGAATLASVGHSSSPLAAKFAALAFSKSDQLVTSLGHVSGDSSRLRVASIRPSHRTAGSTPASGSTSSPTVSGASHGNSLASLPSSRDARRSPFGGATSGSESRHSQSDGSLGVRSSGPSGHFGESSQRTPSSVGSPRPQDVGFGGASSRASSSGGHSSSGSSSSSHSSSGSSYGGHSWPGAGGRSSSSPGGGSSSTGHSHGSQGGSGYRSRGTTHGGGSQSWH